MAIKNLKLNDITSIAYKNSKIKYDCSKYSVLNLRTMFIILQYILFKAGVS